MAITIARVARDHHSALGILTNDPIVGIGEPQYFSTDVIVLADQLYLPSRRLDTGVIERLEKGVGAKSFAETIVSRAFAIDQIDTVNRRTIWLQSGLTRSIPEAMLA